MPDWPLEIARPFNTRGLLAYLKMRLAPGVEQLRGSVYQRVVELDGDPVDVEVDLERAASSGVIRIRSSCDPASVRAISERVGWFVDAAWDPAAESALRQDELLADLIMRRPGLRIPGTMAPYEVAVRAIVGQQISVAAATTIMGRMVRQFGRPVRSAFAGLDRAFPIPAVLAAVPFERSGLSRTRARAIRELSAGVAEGRIALRREPADLEAIRAVHGVGEWTVSYLALRGLGCRDSIPVADLGLRAAASSDRRTPVSAAELARRSESWKPFRGLAAVHLWSSLLLDPPPNADPRV